ncbi:hypothetical protein [Gimesia algae]|uniref:Uncharacterized protein n=1 Tax=Gimesia algae TaxID=2527971 RepID=A0A517VDQ9_9PLAN|nr:hypothetical protein [Gimesia algae]QDT91132.1 hypothetical protein Pan161_27870 [Gimesia algae]
MEPAINLKLFPWTVREFGRGLCFIFAFSLLYLLPYMLQGWVISDTVKIVMLTMIYIMITFYLALLCQNRLLPYLILLLFWSIVVIIPLPHSMERLLDAFLFVCIEFVITASFIFILQFRFIAVEKSRLRNEIAGETAAIQRLFPCSVKEIVRGVVFFIILCMLYSFQVFYLRNLGLLRGLALSIYLFQLIVLTNCFMAILCQNRLIPHLVVASFWAFFALFDYLSPSARLYQTTGIVFLINVSCIFIMQLVSGVAERRLRVRKHPAIPQMNES